jgi:hypothetical protein
VSQFEFIDLLMAPFLTNCCMLTGSALGIFMGSNGSGVRMSVRILDDSGGEIASFFSDKPEADEGGFSAGLRDALLAFQGACSRVGAWHPTSVARPLSRLQA